MPRILLSAGARPNFMKVAPIHRALAARGVRPLLVHAGQHRGEQMSEVFLRQLGLEEPDVRVEAAGPTPLARLAAMITRLDEVVRAERPDLVVVVGDVDATLAAALAASRNGVRLAHVEAGLRSGDRGMPEEINRILVDALSDLLFATEPSAVEHLRSEGVPGAVHLVGNVMADTLLAHREEARSSDVLARLGLPGGGHAVATLHRPSNVDAREALSDLLGLLGDVARILPVVLPLHPRTREAVLRHGLEQRLDAPGLTVTPPLGYLDFVRLIDTAAVVLTDSGGVQEETTVLGVPCLTLRPGTERPITVASGTNRVVGTDPGAVLAAAREILDAPGRRPRRDPARPPLWDGRAAERIADVLLGEPA